MLTKVILDGVMGREFGKEWDLAVSSPVEALQLIDANKPGVFTWINNNLETYSHYKILCEYENGSSEELDEDSLKLANTQKLKSVRFTPIVSGASGGIGKVIVGAILVVVGTLGSAYGLGWMVPMGWGMIVGGIIQELTSNPSAMKKQDGTTSLNSYYFNGPSSNSMQGAPVPLVYGRVKVGSQCISAQITIDRLA